MTRKYVWMRAADSRSVIVPCAITFLLKPEFLSSVHFSITLCTTSSISIFTYRLALQALMHQDYATSLHFKNKYQKVNVMVAIRAHPIQAWKSIRAHYTPTVQNFQYSPIEVFLLLHYKDQEWILHHKKDFESALIRERARLSVKWR